ncbi:MAG: NAD-dependent epimerase/dehydratase family protein [Candidatus Aenigmarchaeota archaeon]|nr:NAD-dependent epimerase/dehydratase family protein [Candidatus Aenigmarchaeota archaeon]
MAVLVTGGTGFVGRRLVHKLLRGGRVVVFSRHEDAALKQRGARFVLGTITDKDALEKAFPGVKLVYHLAANLDESDPAMVRDNVTGTRNVVELCRKHGTKLVFMSSCGVLGDAPLAREDAPVNPKTLYEKSKAESERLVIESGVRYSIVRAPVIIGPNDTWLDIFRAAQQQYPVIGSGKNHFHLAYVDDVAEVLYRASRVRHATGKVFHVSTKDSPTYEEVYTTLCSAMRAEMTPKKIPLAVMLLVSSIYSVYCAVLRKKPKLTMMKSSILRLTRDRIVDMSNTRKILKFTPRYTTRRAIEATARFFSNRKMLQPLQ